MAAGERDNSSEREKRAQRVFRFDVEIDDESPHGLIGGVAGTPIDADDVPPPSEWPDEGFAPIAPPAKPSKQAKTPLPPEQTVPLDRTLPPAEEPVERTPSIAGAETAQVRELEQADPVAQKKPQAEVGKPKGERRKLAPSPKKASAKAKQAGGVAALFARLREALTRDVKVTGQKEPKAEPKGKAKPKAEAPPRPSRAAKSEPPKAGPDRPAVPKADPAPEQKTTKRSGSPKRKADQVSPIAAFLARLRDALTRDVKVAKQGKPKAAAGKPQAPKPERERRGEPLAAKPAETPAPPSGEPLSDVPPPIIEPPEPTEQKAAAEARPSPVPTPAPAAEPAPPSAEPPAPAEGESEAPRPQRRGMRRLVGSDDEAEARRAERERRRLERRRREEQRRERKERREKAVRELRARITGFVRGQIDEESAAWSKRRERLAERKRKREAKRREAERKREAKRRRREENPTAIDKARMRFNAWRAARARKAARNIAGLEIGASALRAVHLRDGEVIEIIERPLPDGVIIDGILEEPAELTDALKQMWKDKALRTKKVNFSITNRLVTLRTISLAAENPEDVPQALALMAGDVIAPMDPEKSIIDYAELSRAGARSDLQVAAADEAMVKAYTQAIEKAGLMPVSCELGPLAAGRALVVPRSPRKAHLVVDIGAERTTVTAASGPDVFFFRTIEIGGNDFTGAIRSKLGIGFNQAEDLKHLIGLEGQLPANVDPEQARAARQAMRPVADRLCQEISQTKRAYEEATFEGERTGREIEGYFLLGGGAKLRGLDRQIELFAGLPQRGELRAHPNVEGAPDIELTATCLGLARGHTMSLLPQASSTSFSLTNPFRRKPKISLSDAERQGKRLAAGRNQKQKTDPRLLGLLGALAIFAGTFYLGQGSEPDDAAVVDPVINQGGAQVKLTYENDERAGQIAEGLLSSAEGAALRKLPRIYAQNKAKIVRVTIDGTRVVISATAANGAAPERVERSVRQAVPTAVSVSMQIEQAAGKGQAFTVVLDVPHDPKLSS